MYRAAIRLALLVTATFAATACSLGADDGAGQSNDAITSGATAQPGTFKLFTQQGGPPSPNVCSVRADLVLGPGKKATLDKSPIGACPEVTAFPEHYAFNLKGTVDGCGSKILEGKSTSGGSNYAFRLVDNRDRTCDDVIPALLVLEETKTTGGVASTTKFYSQDPAPTDLAPAPGSFKLYPQPGGVSPVENCDVYTRLEFWPTRAAMLTPSAEGPCAIVIDLAMPSAWELHGVAGRCNSKVFTATTIQGSITITDWRDPGNCDETPPAKIVVEQTINGITHRSYSAER